MTDKLPKSAQSRSKSGEERVEEFRQGGGPFVAAVEATRMPMVVSDASAIGNPIVYANGAFLDLTGYEPAEILGKSYFFLAGPDTDPAMETQMRSALDSDEPVVREVLLYKKSGYKIWVAQFISSIRNSEGAVVQHFASFLDISQRVEAEQRVRQSAEELEHKVVERTNDLREEVDRRRKLEALLRQQLQESDTLARQREVLVQEVNHRAKNSFAMVASLLQLQREQTSGETADILEKAIQRLSHFAKLHDMLSVKGADFQSVDMREYLTSVSREFCAIQSGTEANVECVVHADPIKVDVALAINLAVIVGEGVMNAVKYAFPDQRRGQIRVDLRSSDQRLELSVADNGVGFPSRPRSGSLGMRLIERLVKSLEGTLSVDSGAGTTLRITFPYAPTKH